MSMIHCQGCALLIDSDADPACFVEDDPYDREVVCEGCREDVVREDIKMAERENA